MNFILEIKENNKISLINNYRELKIEIFDIYDFINNMIDLIDDLCESPEFTDIEFNIIHEKKDKVLLFRKKENDKIQIILDNHMISEIDLDDLIKSVKNLIIQVLDDLEEKVIEEIEMRKENINTDRYYTILLGRFCEFMQDYE